MNGNRWSVERPYRLKDQNSYRIKSFSKRIFLSAGHRVLTEVFSTSVIIISRKIVATVTVSNFHS